MALELYCHCHLPNNHCETIVGWQSQANRYFKLSHFVFPVFYSAKILINSKLFHELYKLYLLVSDLPTPINIRPFYLITKFSPFQPTTFVQNLRHHCHQSNFWPMGRVIRPDLCSPPVLRQSNGVADTFGLLWDQLSLLTSQLIRIFCHLLYQVK
jgi:hypothetical protein